MHGSMAVTQERLLENGVFLRNASEDPGQANPPPWLRANRVSGKLSRYFGRCSVRGDRARDPPLRERGTRV